MNLTCDDGVLVELQFFFIFLSPSCATTIIYCNQFWASELSAPSFASAFLLWKAMNLSWEWILWKVMIGKHWSIQTSGHANQDLVRFSNWLESLHRVGWGTWPRGKTHHFWGFSRQSWDWDRPCLLRLKSLLTLEQASSHPHQHPQPTSSSRIFSHFNQFDDSFFSHASLFPL